MPLALENNLGYSSDEVQQVMIGYWISTFMGSLFSGFLLNYLVGQGYSIHRARLTGFTGFSLLTSLAAVAAFLPPGLLFICLMLVIGFASLGLFPIYYSLNQEFSAKNQGKVGGSLGFTTWVVLYFFHPWIGQIMDHNPSLRPYISLPLACCRLSLQYYLRFCGIAAGRVNPCPLRSELASVYPDVNKKWQCLTQNRFLTADVAQSLQ